MITDSILELPLDIFKKFDVFSMPPRAHLEDPDRKAAYQKVGLLILLGYGIRTIAASVGISKNTVKKIRDHMREHDNIGHNILSCECGKERGHQGWCSWRFKRSTERQQVVKNFNK